MKYHFIFLVVILHVLILSKCTCHDKLIIDKVLIDIIPGTEDLVLKRENLREMVLKLLKKNESIALDLNANVNSALRVVFSSHQQEGAYKKPSVKIDLMVNRYIDSKKHTYYGGATKNYVSADQVDQILLNLFNSSLDNLIHEWRVDVEGNTDLLVIIEQYLADKPVDKSEVEQAVYMLGVKKEKKAVGLLGKILLGKNSKLAILALVALTQIADPDSIDYITQFAERKNADIRKQAILAARQIGGVKAAAWLFTLSTGYADVEIRQLAGEALIAVEETAKID